MFVKHSWSERNGKRYDTYHIAESYRDPESGQPRHRLLLNISSLPQHVIRAIDQSLKQGKTIVEGSIELRTGDSLRGAGLLAVYRAWKQADLERILGGLTTPAERQSILAMVAQRILNPGSKLALKRQFRDTLFARVWAQTRLDEDELYRVMDVLEAGFYTIQQRLQRRHREETTLALYDVTSTYFEGTEAEEGAYGYSRDKRWDRYQIVIGLVCNAAGLPLAVEVWPGNTRDLSTVSEQLTRLREDFHITEAVFVGDKGMYGETALEALTALGFDYILSVNWQQQRAQLEALAPEQLDLFDRIGVYSWVEDGVRYVGCASEARRLRAAQRREAGMEQAREQLTALAQTAASGRYYHQLRLWEKARQIIADAGVPHLWQLRLRPLEAVEQPDQKARLELTFVPDEAAIERCQRLEGKYVLETTLGEEEYTAEQIDQQYRALQQVERAFRNIKSYLRIRPIYHHLRRRIRAHVLICFLAFYLVKSMELELRAQGIQREVIPLLREWDQLRLVEHELTVGGHRRHSWQWALGQLGAGIQAELQAIGWWRSIDAHRRSLLKALQT